MESDLVGNQIVDLCESTNDLARKLAEEGAPHGTWISARKQLSGRGRLGRKWESIEGNLFLSIIVRVPTANQNIISWIPMVSAISIADFLRQFNPRLAVKVKWPNDLWIEGAKVGGLLCEAVRDSAGTQIVIVIGIGLNCAKAPMGLDQQAASLSETLGSHVDVDEIRLPIIGAVLESIGQLMKSGPDAFAEKFNLLAAISTGAKVQWSVGDRVLSGQVQGLGKSGELLVQVGNEVLRLYAEDIKIRQI